MIFQRIAQHFSRIRSISICPYSRHTLNAGRSDGGAHSNNRNVFAVAHNQFLSHVIMTSTYECVPSPIQDCLIATRADLPQLMDNKWVYNLAKLLERFRSPRVQFCDSWCLAPLHTSVGWLHDGNGTAAVMGPANTSTNEKKPRAKQTATHRVTIKKKKQTKEYNVRSILNNIIPWMVDISSHPTVWNRSCFLCYGKTRAFCLKSYRLCVCHTTDDREGAETKKLE